jgi:quinoprotein glucose dehydrogenase
MYVTNLFIAFRRNKQTIRCDVQFIDKFVILHQDEEWIFVCLRNAHNRASVDGVGPFHTFSASMGRDAAGRDIMLPCQRPPWSRLIAIHANTGEIAWETTLGINENLSAGKQNVGGSGSAGPTVTAGGLVFVGATDERRCRAFGSKTGKELWVTKLEAVGNAHPISYRARNGKQYVAIVATDQVVVFALP